MQTEKITKKEIVLRIAAFVISVVILAGAVWVFWKKSGAWLVDKGKWDETSYVVGHINYTLYLNNNMIDFENDLIYDTAVPIIGGVKINDSETAQPGTENYQQYAEENFNEGVTVVNMKIINNSDFAINMTADLSFDGLFDDDADSNDIFYLVLPMGTSVDTSNYTITLPGQTPVSYKSYVKSCLDDYSTYESIKNSLKAYYALGENSGLTSIEHTVLRNTGSNESPDEGSYIEIHMLVWSEYDQLPFVTNGELTDESENPDSISGSFELSMGISQRVS